MTRRSKKAKKTGAKKWKKMNKTTGADVSLISAFWFCCNFTSSFLSYNSYCNIEYYLLHFLEIFAFCECVFSSSSFVIVRFSSQKTLVLAKSGARGMGMSLWCGEKLPSALGDELCFCVLVSR